MYPVPNQWTEPNLRLKSDKFDICVFPSVLLLLVWRTQSTCLKRKHSRRFENRRCWTTQDGWNRSSRTSTVPSYCCGQLRCIAVAILLVFFEAAAWHVLRTFYGSKAFGKRRFLRMRRKQALVFFLRRFKFFSCGASLTHLTKEERKNRDLYRAALMVQPRGTGFASLIDLTFSINAKPQCRRCVARTLPLDQNTPHHPRRTTMPASCTQNHRPECGGRRATRS